MKKADQRRYSKSRRWRDGHKISAAQVSREKPFEPKVCLIGSRGSGAVLGHQDPSGTENGGFWTRSDERAAREDQLGPVFGSDVWIGRQPSSGGTSEVLRRCSGGAG